MEKIENIENKTSSFVTCLVSLKQKIFIEKFGYFDPAIEITTKCMDDIAQELADSYKDPAFTHFRNAIEHDLLQLDHELADLGEE